MTTHIDMEEVRKQFKIVCLKCNSEDVVMHMNEGTFKGSDVTAADPDEFTMGCNGCKQNDLWQSGY